MRISDWSSDVCSSDLSFEPAQLEADRAAADLANRDGDGVLLPIDDQGCPDFETTDAGACLVDPQFRKIKAQHYFDLTARFNVSENLVFTATVQNLLDNKPPIVGNRSEEHTSELQSLMRISYAVFCLKK